MNSAPSMAAGVWLVVSPGIPAYAEHACFVRGRSRFDSIGILHSLCLNKEIAAALTLTVTVKGYVSDVLMKLGVSDRTQAALMAVRFGLVKPEDI